MVPDEMSLEDLVRQDIEQWIISADARVTKLERDRVKREHQMKDLIKATGVTVPPHIALFFTSMEARRNMIGRVRELLAANKLAWRIITTVSSEILRS
jgi:hypothetical protein